MKQKSIVILLIILLLFEFPTKVFAEKADDYPNLKLYALSAILMDGESGRVLYARDKDRVMSNASTTKILTCILALEYGNKEDLVTISSLAAMQPKVRLGVKKGETYRLSDLLYSLMLESHNDVAVAIAEHIGGSVEGFSKLMNQKLKELGCVNTYFITPNGLDAEDENGKHSTTANELARIMAYCIGESPKKEEFLALTKTASYQFTDVSGKRSFYCGNHNAFLTMMEGALTGKTGFTGKAGYCYVGALRREEKTFIVVLLGCGWPNNRAYKWSDTKTLMNYGLENFTYRSLDTIPVNKEKLKEIPVKNGQGDCYGEEAKVSLAITKNEATFLGLIKQNANGVLMKEKEVVEVVYEIPKELTAPIKSGSIVGSVSYQINGETFRKDNVIVKKAVEKVNYSWCLKEILNKIF